MKVLVNRYLPGEKRYKLSEYVIDDGVTDGMTVMDLLGYISQNIDPTLGYYSHSVCNHGICKRCVIKINGKTALACTTRVRDYTQLRLEPANTTGVIRDLVVHT